MTTSLPAGARAPGRDAFRTVLGQFATGVTVLTAGRRAPRGMTANSFTSVSLDPPLVLVCVARTASAHAAVLGEGAFAVSILSAGQSRPARHFADHHRAREGGEFDPVDTFPGPVTGAPLISGALAWLECSVAAVHDGGDHSIVVGSVLGLSHGTPGEPLLYFGGAFRP
ncbi:flavin reductase family protein [Actinacidiphila acididurans]|uniref:Flavin reductase family protein n=1 Tax=Actinacidiphila acididurans TaxID=2784346 RepID=A0ABS2TZW9_9ACTN|nr:flavin reductase family protein [Actinacidiphila acididurans]MBM9508894.1 flavin reductase family protein [Actinacidiphila acididurans]